MNNNHILRGLTPIPSDDNFCSLLINVKSKKFLIEKGKNLRNILDKEVTVLILY